MRVNIGDVLVCDSRDALGAVGERGYAGANDEHLAQISDRRGPGAGCAAASSWHWRYRCHPAQSASWY
jgi:hypothetical protein